MKAKSNRALLAQFLALALTLLAIPSMADVRHLNPPKVTPNSGFSIVLQEMYAHTDFFLRAKLTHPDEEAAFPIIAEFVLHFRKLTVESAHGMSDSDFLARQDALVKNARSEFSKKLSKAGSIRLEAFIRQRIANIRVNAPQVTES